MINNILTEILQQVELANRCVMAQTVEDTNVNIQFDPDGVIKNLSNLSNEDQQTPELLIEKMCKQYTEIKTTDIFLDACCGRGAMLVYLHTYYNIPKDQLYGIELKEENVRLLNKLGYHNIILGDILDDNTWAKLYDKLSYNIKGRISMKFDKVIMNPPYSGNLHLKILEKVLKECKPEDGCEIVNLSPIRWIQDPLAEYKQGSDRKKFASSILSKIKKLNLVNAADATRLFNIDTGSDLAIYVFNNKKNLNEINIVSPVVKSCIQKILTKTLLTLPTLADKIEANKIKGYRCEIKEMLPEGGSHSLGASTYSKQCGVMVVLGPYTDGLDKDNVFFSEARAKNGREKNYFRYSISFTTKEEANFFAQSSQTNFYKNLTWILKYDQHTPLRFLPYMEDYSHIWTDEDYCKFFWLNEEESKFMCRTVDDYRVKDFINYEEF